MNYILRLITWRYLLKARYEQTLSTMTIISFAGIFIGSFALTLVTAIMNGFDIETQKKMQGIKAQASINAYGQPIDMDALTSVLTKEFPHITHYAPLSEEHGLLDLPDGTHDEPAVVGIKAIDPTLEKHVTTLAQKIQQPATLDLLDATTVIIGSGLAEQYGIETGDMVHLFYTTSTKPQRNKITFNQYDVTVGGIITTGIDDFDTRAVLCSFSLFNTLFPDKGVQEVQLAFDKTADEQTILTALKKRFALNVYTWKELYPALVSALKLEKYVAFFVLALIALVASMNVISLLFIKITQKRRDIAILKAIGAPHTLVTRIFLLMGITLSCFAGLCGIVCAMGASWLLNAYPFIHLPDVYYVSHLPSHMSWYIPCAVFALILVMSFLATWIPARSIRTISVSQTLRSEG